MHPPSRRSLAGFSRTDLLVIIAVVIVAVLAVGMLLLPDRSLAKRHAQMTACKDNLHQISKGFATWLIDNRSQLFPIECPASVGGPPGGDPTISAMCADGRGEDAAKLLYQVFLVMSNEMRTPQVLHCPAEYARSHSCATTFTATVPQGSGKIPFGPGVKANYQVSYFLNGEANDAYPSAFLVGDHAIGNGTTGDSGEPIAATRAYGSSVGSSGCFISGGTGVGGVSTNKPTAAWMDNSQHGKIGYVVLCDGSVQGLTISKLRDSLAHTGDPHNNMFLFPPTD